MAIEVLRCPACSGNDNSRADAHGVHTCVYCGVRYRISASSTQPVVVGGTTKNPAVPVLAVVVVAAALVAIGAVVFMGMPASPTKPAAAPVDVASPAPAAAPIDVASPAIATASAPVSTPSPAAPESVASAPAVVVVAEPTPVVEPEPTPVARFELDSERKVSETIFYAVGWAHNDSAVAIDKLKVTAVLRDAKGVEVGTAFGFSDDLILPGERQPTEIIVTEAPAFASMTFEVSPRKATYIPPTVDGLRLEVGPVSASGGFGSSLVVKGKVFHEGDVPARFVRIRALGFDASDKLLGLYYTYADAEVLAPGASARFNIYMHAPVAPKRWEFSVRGSPAG
jgi:hypothetical protein